MQAHTFIYMTSNPQLNITPVHDKTYCKIKVFMAHSTDLVMKTRRIAPLKSSLNLIIIIILLSGPILHVQKQVFYRVHHMLHVCIIM